MKNVDSSEVIIQSKEELLECIQNLMGAFDTPIARRLIKGNFSEEARKIGRQILESNINKNESNKTRQRL